MREALAELVACKDLNDWLGSEESFREENFDRWKTGHVEYARRKPLAWEKARAALASEPAPQAGEPRVDYGAGRTALSGGGYGPAIDPTDTPPGRT